MPSPVQDLTPNIWQDEELTMSLSPDEVLPPPYQPTLSQQNFLQHFNQAPTYESKFVPVTGHEKKDGTPVRAHKRLVKVPKAKTTKKRAQKAPKEPEFEAKDNFAESVKYAKSMHIMFQQELASGKDLEKEFIAKHSQTSSKLAFF